jgi:hypothetical protein
MDLTQTSMAAMSQAPAKILETMQHNASSTLAEATLPEEHPRRSRRKEH